MTKSKKRRLEPAEAERVINKLNHVVDTLRDVYDLLNCCSFHIPLKQKLCRKKATFWTLPNLLSQICYALEIDLWLEEHPSQRHRKHI